jgi:hypothetical protein
MMNLQFLIAAILASIITVGHALIGELLFFKGIKDTCYPCTLFGDGNITKLLMKTAWHLLTVALGMSAFALFALALSRFFTDPQIVAKFIFWEYVGLNLVVAGAVITRPRIFIRAPLWIVTVGVAALTWGY